ncbi:MAG: Trp biosynthesis-associated membrane protein [Leucobacter sp.]
MLQKFVSKRALITQIFLWGVLALIATTQTWVSIEVDAGAGVQQFEASGQSLNAALSPIAVATLAAAIALTIAGRVFRRILSVLVVLLGVGLIALVVGVMQDPAAASAGGLAELTGLTGGGNAELVTSMTVSVWPVVLGVSGALTCLSGAFVTVLSGRWVKSGQKYEAGAAPARAQSPGSDRISDWDALSDGDDPSEEGDTGNSRSTPPPQNR